MTEDTDEIEEIGIPELATRLRNAIAAADTTVSRKSMNEMLAVTEAVRDAAERVLATPTEQAPTSGSIVGFNGQGDAVQAFDLDIERLKRARDRVENEPMSAYASMGARVPRFLDEYLNAFVSRKNRQRRRGRRSDVTKQEVIAEALCLFYAVHQMPPTGEAEVW